MAGASDDIHVLHVDDEPEFAELAATFLERTGDRFDVEVLSDPREGLDHLDERRVDCVVSDFDMPEQNGIEFLEAVREDHPDIPFILFTGKGSEEVASEAISAEVTDYIQKGSGTSQYEVLANRIANAVERRRAHQEASETKRRLETIAENSNDVLWQFTADWDELLFVNSAYEELWGQSVDELRERPRSFLDGVHPDDTQLVRRSMEELSAGDPVDVEFRVNADEGFGRWVWVQGEPVFDDTGEVAKVVGFARDVTERKERERAIERSQNRYQTVFESTGDAIAWVEFEDGAPIIREANPAFETLFAPPDVEVVGADIDELVASDERIDDARESTRLVRQGESLEREVTRDTVSGPREFRWRAVPIEDPRTGEVEAGFAVYSDITDLKEREQERETTIEFLLALYDLATDSDLDVHEKITRLLEVGPEQLGLPYGHLTRIEVEDPDSEAGTQTVVEASGDHDLLQPGDSCPLSRSYCRRTIRTDGLFEVRDAQRAGWAGDPAYETFELESYIGTRITVDGELYGTVFFASSAPREEPFTERERMYVRLLSQLVSYELEREHT
jgi:PAS domain S-box-containing protein